MNEYEITIRRTDKKQKRTVIIKSEMGIDWLKRAVKAVGE